MADYSTVKVGGKRLLKMRLGTKVIWETDQPPAAQVPEGAPAPQEKDTPDDR